MTKENRMALLIDGENLSAEHADFALATAAKDGSVIIRRVYGHLGKTGKWATKPGFRVMHTPSGKNIGDIALSLDALELALTDQADAFFLATSDRDLALVALRLRELGFPVTGIGEAAKVAPEFRAACRAFVPVPNGKAAAPDAASMQAAPARKPPFDERLKEFLRREGAGSDGWVALNVLGQPRARSAGISKADAGIGKSASWLDWLKKRRDTFEIEERGTQSRARILPKKS